MFILRHHLRRELFSIYHQKSQLSYSTSTKSSSIDQSTTAIRTEFINYLINTLNFTTESAISSSSKILSHHHRGFNPKSPSSSWILPVFTTYLPTPSTSDPSIWYVLEIISFLCYCLQILLGFCAFIDYNDVLIVGFLCCLVRGVERMPTRCSMKCLSECETHNGLCSLYYLSQM
ncbi:hypothetical protein HanIR_Chr11g0503471 [Helianthus annuus]|nr:hypothetical protein HanIR_Chr11g0503471 [Helianthus annuus]